jgi:hypothetical protein
MCDWNCSPRNLRDTTHEAAMLTIMLEHVRRIISERAALIVVANDHSVYGFDKMSLHFNLPFLSIA